MENKDKFNYSTHPIIKIEVEIHSNVYEELQQYCSDKYFTESMLIERLIKDQLLLVNGNKPFNTK